MKGFPVSGSAWFPASPISSSNLRQPARSQTLCGSAVVLTRSGGKTRARRDRTPDISHTSWANLRNNHTIQRKKSGSHTQKQKKLRSHDSETMVNFSPASTIRYLVRVRYVWNVLGSARRSSISSCVWKSREFTILFLFVVLEFVKAAYLSARVVDTRHAAPRKKKTHCLKKANDSKCRSWDLWA